MTNNDLDRARRTVRSIGSNRYDLAKRSYACERREIGCCSGGILRFEFQSYSDPFVSHFDDHLFTGQRTNYVVDSFRVIRIEIRIPLVEQYVLDGF